MNATDSKAIEFFRSMYPNSGDASAVQYATAEAWKDAEIEAGRLRVRWVEDTDPDFSWVDNDSDYARKVAACLVDVHGCIVETKCPKCGQWEHAQSLFGIDTDNSTDETRQQARDYHRLIEAELCLEAMPEDAS